MIMNIQRTYSMSSSISNTILKLILLRNRHMTFLIWKSKILEYIYNKHIT